MPIEDRWPLVDVLAAIREHAETRGARATLAYVVIGGVNSSPAHARALGELLGGMRSKLSLIDVTDETGRYRRATEEELGAFRDALGALGIPAVRRYSGGADIGAACGTLAATRRGGQDIWCGCGSSRRADRPTGRVQEPFEGSRGHLRRAWPARRRAGGRSSPCRSMR